MKKIVLKISLLLCAVLNTQCQTKKESSIDLSQAVIKIDECGIFYKEQKLELGTPLSDWEKVLGKPDRDTNLGKVWDNFSIAIGDWNNHSGFVDEFYIFFTNLDSEDGKKGKLSLSPPGYREFIEEEYRKHDPNLPGRPFTEKEIQEIKEERASKNFIYPYTPYQGYVSLQGSPLKAGMSLQLVNKYRAEKGLDSMTFRDNNMNLVDESGTTVGDNGEYFDVSRYACNGRAYNLIIRYTNYKPEYIHVVLQDTAELDLYYGKDLKKRLD